MVKNRVIIKKCRCIEDIIFTAYNKGEEYYYNPSDIYPTLFEIYKKNSKNPNQISSKDFHKHFIDIHEERKIKIKKLLGK